MQGRCPSLPADAAPPEPIPITDALDPRIEWFRHVREKDLRIRTDIFIAESDLVLRRLLRTPEQVAAVLLSPHRYEELREALEVLRTDQPVYVAELDVLTEIAGFRIHRGVLAAGWRPDRRSLTMENAFAHLRDRSPRDPVTILAAEGLTNVDNMGAIFRNAAAFAADGVLIADDCCDPLYRKAIRVSMGHVLRMPWAIGEPWPAALERLRESWGVKLIGAEVTDNAQVVWEAALPERCVLVLGSEGAGLRAETLALCDEAVQIPMAPGTPSLNVAVTSAVLLYEIQRSRRG